MNIIVEWIDTESKFHTTETTIEDAVWNKHKETDSIKTVVAMNINDVMKKTSKKRRSFPQVSVIKNIKTT